MHRMIYHFEAKESFFPIILLFLSFGLPEKKYERIYEDGKSERKIEIVFKDLYFKNYNSY